MQLHLGGRATHLDAVPILAGEGVLGLLLEALLALGQSLVPALRVSAIGNPPAAGWRLEIVLSVEKSIPWGRNVLANSHLDEQLCQRRDRCAAWLVMETVESRSRNLGVSSLEFVISLCGRSPPAEKLKLWGAANAF
jgi:hypothetical protein